MATVRVLLVDDLQMRADAVSMRLSAAEGIMLLGRYAPTDPDLFTNLGHLRPHVAVFYTAAAQPFLEAAVREFRASWPACDVVVVGPGSDESTAVGAALAGAAAWVPDTSSLEELVAVVRGVHEGGSWYPPHQLGAVLRALRGERDLSPASRASNRRDLDTAAGGSPANGVVRSIQRDDLPPA